MIEPRTLEFFSKEIVLSMVNTYGFSEAEAIDQLMTSETYQLLQNEELGLTRFSPLVIFDLWENERANGDPRLSSYLAKEA